nr:E3 ubiquitin-protein ligase TTC3 isoform X1 [Cavia porcellus]
MDSFTEGDLTVADYALLEDCPDEDECAFAPEFMMENYVPMTQLYCDEVGTQYKDYAQTETNLEFDICNIWCSKPVSDLHDNCDAIKIYIFWPLLFKHQHASVIPRFHPCVEPSNSHASEISLRKLQCLELMEDIVDLAKKVSSDSFLIEGLLKIGYKIENKMLAMEEALNWIKYTGDVTILPKLGSIDSSWPLLSVFFTEYKYHITKAVTENCNLLEEFKTQSCADCIEQGELMKMKGNEEFSKERFDIAIIYYTRAIEYRPDNHFLYGNRALCFLRTGQLRNALGDGKRATILKCSWPKGHYRYCTALSLLGEYDWALQANLKAQKLCKNDPEGIKDLIQQHIKLQKQIEDLQGRTPNKNPIKAFYESRAHLTRNLPAPAFSTSLSFVEKGRDCGKANQKMAYGGSENIREYEYFRFDDCDCQSEFIQTPSHPPRHRGRHRSRNNDSDKVNSNSEVALSIDWKKLLEREFSKTSRAAQQDFTNILKMLRSLIQDGYTALLDHRCRCAAQSFSELLNSLDPQKIKQLNLAMINYVLVVYGLAMSLLGIGRPEELSEAENQFKRILEFYPNEGLDSLAYCGIGKVYLKKNRFQEALTHFEKARTLIYRLPGVLSWPTSNVVIEESRPEKIKMILEKFVEECKFPPVPDAVCSYAKCLGVSKIQIYVTDPDFKGFIRISCCQYCKIEFHMNCWKKLKATTFNDKIDKDFLQGVCLTPDCEGIISKIIIFSRGGRVKCEFEHKVIKEKVPPRPILKQKCSSLEKLKLKEDKKLKRKIQKQEAKKLAQEKREEDLRESNPPKKEQQKEPVKIVQRCPFLDDRILQYLKQSSDKIKSGVLDAPKLLRELVAWKVMTTEDYATCFSNKNFPTEAVDDVLSYLIKENNRVKTRIFLHVLCELQEMEPSVASWLQKLNGFGLDATGTFFTRHASFLKDLDFTIMTFLWNEKYGNRLDSIEGKSLEYFCEPTSLKEARCLIWLLEDHREKFPALQGALDEFFDVMDSRCTVLRKQDHEEPITSTKTKNKGKKKKQKDTKLMVIGSVTSSLAPNNETSTSSHDSNRRKGDPTGPFAVPEHLRQEIEEFEALYEQERVNGHFSQYAEETGPVEIGNRILTEEYEFFPEETRKILEKNGSLKPFLLGCPSFVVIDNCIALRKVTLRLKKRRKRRNMKAKADEVSKIEEYLQAKPSNPAAGGTQPDGQSNPASVTASAPASKDAKPMLAPADPPGPVCEDREPRSGPESSSSSVSEVERPEGVSCDSAKFLPKADTPAPWAQSHAVTTFCSYQPFQGVGVSQTPTTDMSVLLGMPQYTSIYTPPLAGVSSEFQQQRATVPLMPSLTANDVPKQNALLYFKDPNWNAEKADGKPIASETKIPEDSGKSQHDPSESHGSEGALGSSHSSHEVTTESGPRAQEVAVQVAPTMKHQEVNTEPFKPFEMQQGDILQTEKEYSALQEQFKEACRSYVHLKLNSLEEARELEEKLKRNLEENKISETELDWFIQDLEREIKKWEQEKKEIQDRLKTMKKKVKKVLNASETSTQKNDGVDKEYESRPDQSLENSDTFTSERMKIEGDIKRDRELYEESHQRALFAEVSVLESWREGEIHKLQTMASKAEAHLKSLTNSDSEAYPNKESDIHSWESFLSNVAKEITKAKSQFEDQIRAIRSGSRLRDLPQVRVSELSFPACRVVRPQLAPTPPGPESQAPSTSVSSASSAGSAPGAACKEGPSGEAPPAPAPSQKPPESPQQPLVCPKQPLESPQQPPETSRQPPASPPQPPVSPRREAPPVPVPPQQSPKSPQQPQASPRQPSACPWQPPVSPRQPQSSPRQPQSSPRQPQSPRQPPVSSQQPQSSPQQAQSSPQQPQSPRQPPVSPWQPLTSPLQPPASPWREAPPAPVPRQQPTTPRQPEGAPLAEPKKAGQGAPPVWSPELYRKKPVTPGQPSLLSQSPKRPLTRIMEQLSAIFPCYNSLELATFIKSVRSMGTFAGMTIDEIVHKVTEYILDEQKEKKVLTLLSLQPNLKKEKEMPKASLAASVTAPPQTATPVKTGQPTTAAPTTSPLSTVPLSTVPPSTGPPTTAPLTTAQLSTVPLSTGPPTTAPPTTAPPSTGPQTTGPLTTRPTTTAPPTTRPLSAVPPTTGPLTVGPPTTWPVTTRPLTTGPLTIGPPTIWPVTTRPPTTGPPTMGLLTTAPPTTGPLTIGPPTTWPVTTRPPTTGPLTIGPPTTWPVTTGPLTTRLLSTVPPTTAPPATTPTTSGPLTTGPLTTTKEQKTDVPAPRANECEICHEVFKSKNMRALKCGHKFHKGCFKQWLKGHGSCPACRTNALALNPGAP